MKIVISGDMVVAVSEITTADIACLKKANPAALKIKDEKGSDVFAVNYSEGKPSVSSFGISFGGTGRGDNAGKATVTVQLPAGLSDDEAKEWAADYFGGVKAHVEELEVSIPTAAEQVKTARANLVNSITVG